MDKYLYNSNYEINNENRNQKKEDKKTTKNKFDFKGYHKKTVKSLNEVECFLGDFQRFSRYVKVFRFFK